MSKVSLKEAQRIVRQAQKENEKKNIERLSKWLDSHIGDVYVYRKNCYSCPEKPEDYWDTYHYIIKKLDENHILVQEWSLINPKEKHFEIKQSPVYVSDYYADGRSCLSLPK